MKTFTTFREAMEYLQTHENDNSQEYRDAVAAAIELAPPEAQATLQQAFFDVFPELKPDYVDNDGNPYFSTENIQKALGMSDAEMEAEIKKLKAAGVERRSSDELHRIQ